MLEVLRLAVVRILRGIIVIGLLGTSPHLHPTSQRNDQKLTVALMKRTTTPGASEPLEEEKESKREAN
jgi:hypothetical protein